MTLVLRLLLLSSIVGVLTFVPPQTTTRRCPSFLQMAKGEGDESGDSSFDLENARQQLESMLSNTEDDGGTTRKGDDDDATKNKPFSEILADFENGVDFSLSSFPQPPPLSSIERERRLGEIKLLECLKDGDDVVPELWNHWYSERGVSAKVKIEKIGELLTDPKDWKNCEQELIEMVDEYGIYFVEPVNLLATLYFLMGKLQASYKLCEIILKLKPYHVGALSGIVQVSLGLNDPVATREWAAKRLPKSSLGSALGDDGTIVKGKENEEKQPQNPRRVQWVDTAITTAQELLELAEQRTKKDFFGKPETYYDSNSSPATDDMGANFDDEIDGGAWQ